METMEEDTSKKCTGRPASRNMKFASFRTPTARPEEGNGTDIMPEETELGTTSSLTRPPGYTRHANQSTRLSKRRCPPQVEEISSSPSESVEQRSAASARVEEILSKPPEEEEKGETFEHEIGAHRVQGINTSSVSREVSRASSSHHDIIIPCAHVVDESDTITAYMVDPALITFGDGSEKQMADEKMCACVCPCISCQVAGSKTRYKRFLCIATVIVVAALVATFVTLAAKRTPHEELRDLIAKASPDSGVSLENPDSYQYAAFSWLRSKTSRLLPRYRSSESQMIELYALACFYHSLGGDDWTQNKGWMAHEGSPCDWFNVTCSNSPNGNVTTIRLNENNLRGKVFASELVMLTSMEILELKNNFIEATIPEEIGNMSSLFELRLRNSALQGTIPSSLSKLSKLQTLRLHRNDLVGSIPKELSALKNLIYLNLGDNALTGPIPSELSAMKKLRDLKLFHNNLTSTIPTEVGEMTSIVKFDLNRNQLVSTIPSELANLRNLKILKLPRNMLVGSVPAAICNITQRITVDCDVNCSCCEPECK